MLKFLRKYQKWMLVIFCAGLMFAFLIPQAVDQFAPNPATDTMATTFGENTINQLDIRQTVDGLNMLRRLRVEPFVGLSLIPSSGSDSDDALVWLMMQHLADRNGIGASDNEAFQMMATALDAEDMEQLETKADEMGVNWPYLREIGKQYLKAEQVRQLITGVAYAPAGDDENATGSPGLRRFYASREALAAIQQQAQQFEQFVGPQQALNIASQQVLADQGYLDKINGHQRVTADELRYTLQQQNAELDLSVVVMDTDKALDTTVVSDEEVLALFERYKSDEPGTGEPFGLGYRESPKVKLQALRVPIDQVREKVRAEITPEDIREFYGERKEELAAPDEPVPGFIAPERPTPQLRDEVRLILTEMRADQRVLEIAQQVRQRLNEDARGLEDEGSFKALPEGFVPTPLAQVQAEIEQEHGVELELIRVDAWTSSQQIREAARFSQAWLAEMPSATVRLPNQRFGLLVDQPISQAVLSGKQGLFASLVPEISDPAQGRVAGLGDYLSIAKPFIDADSPAAQLGLQPGLPGLVLRDLTRSAYVFRITEARPSRPATELAPIRDQVAEDARKVKAYEGLIAQKDALLKAAAKDSIASLMQNVDAKNTLTGVQRSAITQPRGVTVRGVRSPQPILARAFAASDELNLAGGLEAADEADRLFAIELAGDYKLAIARLDTYRPMTLAAYQEAAEGGSALVQASQLNTPTDADPPLSMEALMRYTGFQWAEGFGPDDLGGGDGEGEDEGADDAEASGESSDADAA